MNDVYNSSTDLKQREEIPPDGTAEELYLELLKKVLVRASFPDAYGNIEATVGPRKNRLLRPVQRLLAHVGLTLVKMPAHEHGVTGPVQTTGGETMLGLPRLNQLHDSIRAVLTDAVPGDFIEAGVWRGGATIFMRATLKAYRDTKRKVWVADSFRGVPPPDTAQYPADQGGVFWMLDYLSVPRERVEANFRLYGLLDNQVELLQGWFRDTLPHAAIERLAILRVDGDSYESTTQALEPLYPKLSVGGYVIIDDYGAVEACRLAVEDYRKRNGITEEIRMVEDDQHSCVWWRRVR